MRCSFDGSFEVQLCRSLPVASDRCGRKNPCTMFEIREGDEETSITSKKDLKGFVSRRTQLNRDDNLPRSISGDPYCSRFPFPQVLPISPIYLPPSPLDVLPSHLHPPPRLLP